MKKSIALQSLAMMAMFADSTVRFDKNESPKRFIKPQKFEPKIPSSLKEYWFDCFGNFVHENPFQYSFHCFALNDKNAVRKFKKFLDLNSVTHPI